AQAMPRRRNQEKLRSEANRFGAVGFGRVVVGLRIERAERGDGDFQNAHRVRVRGQRAQNREYFVGQNQRGVELSVQLFELRCVREYSVPQKIGDFFKRGVGG